MTSHSGLPGGSHESWSTPQSAHAEQFRAAQLTPARLSVGVVSAGRVGTAVGAALERAGHIVFGVAAVSDASVARAKSRLPQAQILPVDVIAGRAELLVLAVPDTELAGLVSGLAATRAVRPGTIVVHVSGSSGVSILRPLAEQGATALAIHPAMTFTGHDDDTSRLANACFGITALDEVGFAIAQSLVIELGGEPVRVPESERTLYHAALALGSNHLVTLVADAAQALRSALKGAELIGQPVIDDQPNGLVERMLAPLLSAALDNALRTGMSALTGPVARGDEAVVARHLDVLTDIDPGLAAGYRAMALRTAQRIHAKPELLEVLEEM